MEATEKKQFIRLRSFTFDPLTEKPGIPSEFQSENVHHLVQFKKPLTPEEVARIQNKYKLRLRDYVPELAYVENIGPEMLTELATEPLVRATVPFFPAFKIEPGIGTRKFSTFQRQQVKGHWLRAVLFSGAEPQVVTKALQNLQVSELQIFDDRKVKGNIQALFIVQSMDVLPEIAQLDAVQWIEEVGEMIADNNRTAGTIQSGTPGDVPVWSQGLHGEGQVIGLIDDPVDGDHCFFRDSSGNVIGPNHRKLVGFRDKSGTVNSSHGTFVAGIAAGDDEAHPGSHTYRGSAWAARITFSNMADIPTKSTLIDYLNAAAEDGALVHTNSWHDDTAGAGQPATYNQTAVEVDTFTWNNEDCLVLGSAGNSGEQQGPPGTAKNAVCVGASMVDPNEMKFGDGNPGPTADGRRKPDLFAPGCFITSAMGNSCGMDIRKCATSHATPAAAAAAALVRQYYTEGFYRTGTRSPSHRISPSGALLKATLLNSTIDMSSISGFPSNEEGWGLIRLNDVLYFPGSALRLRMWDIRHASGIRTGEIQLYQVSVGSNTQRLKVTLVWTEPPGLSASATPIVNNLDLEVESPDGTQIFRGNVFANGASTVGGVADAVNNVEMVLINMPAVGDWTIRIIGTEINVGNPGQGYATVVTGDIS